MKSIEQYISAINDAITFAEADAPRELSDLLISLPGMSSRKGRMFFNHLFRILNDANYLEIGSWMGSTFVSALYQNPNVKGFAIDNLSQFAQSEKQPYPVRETLLKNLELIPHGTFFESDCWRFDTRKLPEIDVYFYDGAHDEQSQYRAWIEYDSVLADTFVAIVDDWEFRPHFYDVQLGTLRAFKQLKYTVERCWFLQKTNRWHEGMFVAVIRKAVKNEA